MDKVLQLELCKLESELFRMSVDYNIDSKSFIDFFMTSSISGHLDLRIWSSPMGRKRIYNGINIKWI